MIGVGADGVAIYHCGDCWCSWCPRLVSCVAICALSRTLNYHLPDVRTPGGFLFPFLRGVQPIELQKALFSCLGRQLGTDLLGRLVCPRRLCGPQRQRTALDVQQFLRGWIWARSQSLDDPKLVGSSSKVVLGC